MSRWLVVIDPQRVFADPASGWAAPRFAETVEPIHALAAEHGDRVLVTRWVPGAEKPGAWRAYFDAWPFADRPADDPLFDLEPRLAGLTERPTLDAPTFGKWREIEAVTGPVPEIVLTGVATDCCVLSTALAAADAGATVTVASAGCAGSSDENHRKALDLMALYAPQITVV